MQCNGDGICDACQIPNFKVWPTELGCRRERLGSLVLFLLPRKHFPLKSPSNARQRPSTDEYYSWDGGESPGVSRLDTQIPFVEAA